MQKGAGVGLKKVDLSVIGSWPVRAHTRHHPTGAICAGVGPPRSPAWSYNGQMDHMDRPYSQSLGVGAAGAAVRLLPRGRPARPRRVRLSASVDTEPRLHFFPPWRPRGERSLRPTGQVLILFQLARTS